MFNFTATKQTKRNNILLLFVQQRDEKWKVFFDLADSDF